ncbi:MAG: ArsR family transcriptional regulator [Candidatus ainarchaeum sp.]|nr:ArsR family transcriptional regulator [Candidatus ainarchaeum sp.]
MGRCEKQLFFGMFANRLKVQILEELMARPMGVTELAGALDAERSKVSHALLSMNACRIVHAEQDGRQRLYSVNNKTVLPMMRIAEKHVAGNCEKCLAMKQEKGD